MWDFLFAFFLIVYNLVVNGSLGNLHALSLLHWQRMGTSRVALHIVYRTAST